MKHLLRACAPFVATALAMACSTAWSANVVQASMSLTDVTFRVVDLKPADGLAASISWGQPALVGELGLVKAVPTYSYATPVNQAFMSSGLAQSDTTHTAAGMASQAWVRTTGDMGAQSALAPDKANAFVANGNTGYSRTILPVTGEIASVDNCYSLAKPTWCSAPSGNLTIAPNTELVVTAKVVFDADYDGTLLSPDLPQNHVPSYRTKGFAGMSLSATNGKLPVSMARVDILTTSLWTWIDDVPTKLDPLAPIFRDFEVRMANTTSDPVAVRFSSSVSASSLMSVTVLPEPGTWATFALGLTGVLWAARRSRVMRA